MTHRAGGQFLHLFGRERSKNINGRKALDDVLLRTRDERRGRLALKMQRTRGKCEGDVRAPQSVPNQLPNQRVGVVVLRIVVWPVLAFPVDRAIAETANSYDWR